MRKIILFIATSIDGYIARSNGDIDWLFTESDYGFAEFYSKIDTTIMGNNTYEAIKALGDFPFTDKENYVATRNPNRNNEPHVKFISEGILEFVKGIKNTAGRAIWLIGGGEFFRYLQINGLVDEFIITLHPHILGEGLPLFPGLCKESELELLKFNSHESGIVSLHYKNKTKYTLIDIL